MSLSNLSIKSTAIRLTLAWIKIFYPVSILICSNRDVFLSTKALKQKNKLPEDLQLVLLLLVEDLKNKSGNPGIHWPNYKNLRD